MLSLSLCLSSESSVRKATYVGTWMSSSIRSSSSSSSSSSDQSLSTLQELWMDIEDSVLLYKFGGGGGRDLDWRRSAAAAGAASLATTGSSSSASWMTFRLSPTACEQLLGWRLAGLKTEWAAAYRREGKNEKLQSHG